MSQPTGALPLDPVKLADAVSEAELAQLAAAQVRVALEPGLARELTEA